MLEDFDNWLIFLVPVSKQRKSNPSNVGGDFQTILDFGVTSHNVIDQSMIINFEMKKIFGGEANQNPWDST